MSGDGVARPLGRVQRLVAAAGAVVAGAVATGAATGALAPADSAGASPSALAAPLTTTVPTASGTLAVVAMGNLSDPFNTFWQLVFRANGTTRWSLVTPPGVADNGGLVVSAAAGAVTAAIVPSGGLHFSPLAHSSDNGRTWSGSVFPEGVAPLPDALAAPAGAGTQWTIVDHGNAAVETGDGAQPAARVSVPSFQRAAGASCSVQALTAITTADGSTFAGSSCASASRVPIFVRSASGWSVIGPAVPANGPVSVLRLIGPGGAGTTLDAVVLEGTGRHRTLRVVRSADGGTTWQDSPGRTLPSGAHLVSVAPGPTGSWGVLWQGAGNRNPRGAVFDGATWSPTVSAPRGSTLLVAGPLSLDALAVDRSVLTDWHRVGATWSRSSVLRVPIQYGSSH